MQDKGPVYISSFVVEQAPALTHCLQGGPGQVKN